MWLGWRADWWALVPLALIAAVAIARQVPAVLHAGDAGLRESRVNQLVLAATLVAALTFAVMIGCFYLASQYLQRAAGYLRAWAPRRALVIVALLVGAAAPLAGRLVDDYGERLPAVLGFVLAAGGLAVLAIPGLPLASLVTIVPLIPWGWASGCCSCPPRARRSTPRRAPRTGAPRRSSRSGACSAPGSARGLAALVLAGGTDAAHRARRDAARLHPVRGGRHPASTRLGAPRGAVPGGARRAPDAWSGRAAVGTGPRCPFSGSGSGEALR